jgi:GGDEF domain-containing protein
VAHSEPIVDTVLSLASSVGIGSADPFSTATTEELINRTDAVLYAAKDTGRNCVMWVKAG